MNKPARDEPNIEEYLRSLRDDALASITWLVTGMMLAWLLMLLMGMILDRMPAGAWGGFGLLLIATLLSHSLRARHLPIATYVLVGGVLAATGSLFGAFPTPLTATLFVIPVILAGVLVDPAGLALVTLTADLLILAMGFWGGGAPVPGASEATPPLVRGLVRLATGGMLLPAVVVGLVALVMSVASRSRHVALAWVWHAYERARQDEHAAREHRAELARSLKALDEAMYRLERSSEQMALARDQAEEARRVKQQFAQTISHELRTPLNLIVGFAELMARSPDYYGATLPPKYLRDLSIVYRNACHLQDLVNDVLDLARIEAAQMSLVLERSDPQDLVQEATAMARGLVESKGLALDLDVAPDLPPLWVDPMRIRQVLFNLLNNAARFTDTGGISVRVWREAEAVHFAVQDTGSGIAPEDLAHIFKEFRQADGSTRRRHEGAGLGLAISQRFVELHNGRIWAESQVGVGSTFHFQLPVGREQLPTNVGHLEDPNAQVRPQAQEPGLLVVTRSPASAAYLSRYVRGCRTVAVPTLDEARRMTQTWMPQVLVVDQATIESAATAPAWLDAHVPVVTCPLPGDGEMPSRWPVDGYLIKPVSRQALWDVLRRFGEQVDRVLIVDDDRDFARLLSRMIDSSVRPYQVITAYSGQEGIRLLQSTSPDIVLLDLVLPDIDGRTLIHQIRACPAGQEIPIVMVSGWNEIEQDETLPGPVWIHKGEGVRPGELVRWIQHVVETTLMFAPTSPAPPATFPR